MHVLPKDLNSCLIEIKPEIFLDTRPIPVIPVNALVTNSLRLIFFLTIYHLDYFHQLESSIVIEVTIVRI